VSSTLTTVAATTNSLNIDLC